MHRYNRSHRVHDAIVHGHVAPVIGDDTDDIGQVLRFPHGGASADDSSRLV